MNHQNLVDRANGIKDDADYLSITCSETRWLHDDDKGGVKNYPSASCQLLLQCKRFLWLNFVIN